MKNRTRPQQTMDDDKLRELVLFISERSEGDKRFGATKLNKLLFYSDFLSYLQFGKSITGHDYQALEHGPAPKALLPILDDMLEKEELAIAKRDHYGLEQKVTVALRSADPKKFSAEEIDLVTRIIDDCWGKNATQLSDMSHKFIGWEAARLKEVIPYESALVSNEVEISDAIFKQGRQLEEVAQKCLARTG